MRGDLASRRPSRWGWSRWTRALPDGDGVGEVSAGSCRAGRRSRCSMVTMADDEDVAAGRSGRCPGLRARYTYPDVIVDALRTVAAANSSSAPGSAPGLTSLRRQPVELPAPFDRLTRNGTSCARVVRRGHQRLGRRALRDQRETVRNGALGGLREARVADGPGRPARPGRRPHRLPAHRCGAAGPDTDDQADRTSNGVTPGKEDGMGTDASSEQPKAGQSGGGGAVHSLHAAGSRLWPPSESLTGGLLAAASWTSPGPARSTGAAWWFTPPSSRRALAGVPEELLADRGPVDPDVALALAEGGRRALPRRLGAGHHGVAGPEPQDGKPVGLVYVAVAGPGGPRSASSTSTGPGPHPRGGGDRGAAAARRAGSTRPSRSDGAGSGCCRRRSATGRRGRR